MMISKKQTVYSILTSGLQLSFSVIVSGFNANMARMLRYLFLLPGDDTTEAKVSLKYSQNRMFLVAEALIPHYDVEAGVKITVTDSDSNANRMSRTSIDVTYRDIPVMNLLGQTW